MIHYQLPITDYRLQANGGFTLLELLIATFLLGVAIVAVTGLAVVGTRSSFENERQNVALGVVNENMENIRGLPYGDVGYAVPISPDEPDGVLLREKTVTNNQQSYDVKTQVSLIDDPANGTLPPGSLNEESADYKQVQVAAAWKTASGNQRDITVTSYVAKGGALQTCTPGDPNGCPGSTNPGEGACMLKEPCPETGVCPLSNKAKPFCPEGAVFCPECYNNTECSAGEVCDASNTCVPGPDSCTASTDCSPGQVCSFGLCADECTADNDCSAGEICNTSTGVCTPPCTDESCECPEGQVCNAATQFCEPEPEIIPECNNTLDDEGDGTQDVADSDCHTDCDAANAASYDPNLLEDNRCAGTGGQCSNDLDDDSDTFIDIGDPGCFRLVGTSCAFDPLEDEPGSCGGSYTTPGYGYPTPSYTTPGYTTPGYGYPTPSYTTPGYTTPGYGYPTPGYATPPLPAQCSDSIDNDADTFIDYPADIGCQTPEDPDERDLGCSDDDINVTLKANIPNGLDCTTGDVRRPTCYASDVLFSVGREHCNYCLKATWNLKAEASNKSHSRIGLIDCVQPGPANYWVGCFVSAVTGTPHERLQSSSDAGFHPVLVEHEGGEALGIFSSWLLDSFFAPHESHHTMKWEVTFEAVESRGGNPSELRGICAGIQP